MRNENSNHFEMHKRRELMADNRRYIIYYTFGKNSDAVQSETESEKNVPVTETINSDSETRNSGVI